MKSKVNLITVLITLAIAGLIIVQVVWINNALILKKAQFDQDIRQALMEVTKQVPRVTAYNRDKTLNAINTNDPLSYFKQASIMGTPFEDPKTKITPTQLDSLIKREFLKKGVNAKYVYGVFNQGGFPLFFKDSSSIEFTNNMRKGGFNIQLFQGDFFAINDFYLSVFFPQKSQYVFSKMWLILSISLVLILVVIYAFYYTVYTIRKQKKISEIKNDFINNMTHELKTPISTIQLACEALKDVDMQQLETKDQFVDIINKENKRLGGLVETVLKTAVLDKGELKLKTQTFDLNQVIHQVVKNFELKINQANGDILIEEEKIQMNMEGDLQHLSNVFSNLIDNAIKYSNQEPKINIITGVKNEFYTVKVIDNGIGIKKENQDKVFDKLYRVPTGDVHDVKGFGLGLNYVKSIIEKHGGTVGVKSTFGKGSTFVIALPIKQEAKTS